MGGNKTLKKITKPFRSEFVRTMTMPFRSGGMPKQQQQEQQQNQQRNSWGFKLNITLSICDGPKKLDRLIKSLPYRTAHHEAIITIRDCQLVTDQQRKHYDHWGYEVQTATASSSPEQYERDLNSVFTALGRLPLRDLVFQDSTAVTAAQQDDLHLLREVTRLRHLSVCLKGLREQLQSLKLSGLILLASGAEVEEFAKIVGQLSLLRQLEINSCVLVVEDPTTRRVSDRDGWSSILGSCSKLPSLETLHLTGDVTQGPAVVAPMLQYLLSPKVSLEQRAPGKQIQSLMEGLQTRPAKKLKELTLSCLWNQANARLVRYLGGRQTKSPPLEKLNLSLQMPTESDGVVPKLDILLQAITSNKHLKHIQLRMVSVSGIASAGTSKQVQSVDPQTWNNLRLHNLTLQDLQITPEPPLHVQVRNDLWLTLNRAGNFDTNRLEDENPAVWTHILSYTGISNNLDEIYDMLSFCHPILIPQQQSPR